MRSGEVMVTDISPLGRGSMSGVMSFPGSSFPAGSGAVREADMMWREKTGEKTGWLVKRDEEKIFSIKGMRCLDCGYLEFYAE
jgi:hypothetical protein